MEKRSGERKKQHFQVGIRAGGEVILAKTADVSDTGLFVLTPRVFRPGTKGRGGGRPRDGRDVLPGTVAWSKQTSPVSYVELHGGMGIAFSTPPTSEFLRLLCQDPLGRPVPDAQCRFLTRTAAEADAVLAIQSNEEAEVVLDGENAGRTHDRFWQRVGLAAGRHTVELRSTGGRGRIELRLEAGEVRSLPLDLTERLGEDPSATLRVLSELGPFRLLLDDLRYGCPTRIRGLLPGRKRVEIELDGMTFQEELLLEGGRVTEYVLTLERVARQFHVNLARFRPRSLPETNEVSDDSAS